MRDIKFRGISLIEEFIYGSLLIDNTQNKYYIVDNNEGIAREVKKETVGQYTGLKDKNQVEIYEGDIVYVASEDENAFILWDKETARYIIQFNGWSADFDNYYGKDLEVIGNIYDNPDLLEKGAEE